MRFESWKIYHIARKHLPKDFLQSLYTRSSRLVYAWAANPRDCDETARNPIDRIRLMLEALDDEGYGDYARAAIDYMAEPLGCHCAEKSGAKSDKGTVDGEIADLASAVGNVADHIRDFVEKGKGDPVQINEAIRYGKRQFDELLDAAGMNKESD
ncbi:hypothetical protein LCGC14_2186840 [marine sediment metagenome]|uniref:Uncharacterized protein n=1 Tax=marine sediment metagenome TaxID=412755 RepID=A0A0F9E7W3_9ZZZZ